MTSLSVVRAAQQGPGTFGKAQRDGKLTMRKLPFDH
jgi:hypothetical protein